MERMEKAGWKQPRKSGPRWVTDEIETLERMLDEGATQLELAAALPHRSWEKIRKRVTILRGKEFKVPESGRTQPNETFQDYLDRNPADAVAMKLSISENYSRQIPQNKQHHRLCRLNLAALKSPEIRPIVSLRECETPTSAETMNDKSSNSSDDCEVKDAISHCSPIEGSSAAPTDKE